MTVPVSASGIDVGVALTPATDRIARAASATHACPVMQAQTVLLATLNGKQESGVDDRHVPRPGGVLVEIVAAPAASIKSCQYAVQTYLTRAALIPASEMDI